MINGKKEFYDLAAQGIFYDPNSHKKRWAHDWKQLLKEEEDSMEFSYIFL